jgi:hypothetical protein
MVSSFTSEPVKVVTDESGAFSVSATVRLRNMPATLTLVSGGLRVPVPVTMVSACTITNERVTVGVAPAQRPVNETVGASAKVTGTLTCMAGPEVVAIKSFPA